MRGKKFFWAFIISFGAQLALVIVLLAIFSTPALLAVQGLYFPFVWLLGYCLRVVSGFVPLMLLAGLVGMVLYSAGIALLVLYGRAGIAILVQFGRYEIGGHGKPVPDPERNDPDGPPPSRSSPEPARSPPAPGR
jgi:hypothetical protein